MKSVNTARRFLSLALVAAITTGFLASASPSHATIYCHWSPRGTICNNVP